MPERVEVRAAAKIFFVKSLVVNRVLTYSEYTLPEAEMATTRGPAGTRGRVAAEGAGAMAASRRIRGQ
jgi:hypothetical protein